MDKTFILQGGERLEASQAFRLGLKGDATPIDERDAYYMRQARFHEEKLAAYDSIIGDWFSLKLESPERKAFAARRQSHVRNRDVYLHYAAELARGRRLARGASETCGFDLAGLMGLQNDDS